MTRPIDHLVLAVHDLEAARDLYRRMGFALAPVGRHPWGTVNSLVQMGSTFLELLAVADPALIPPMAPGFFSFGAFNHDYLARREGFSMLVLNSKNAKQDRDEFAAAGIGDYSVFDFGRKAKQPDGTEAEIAFSLAFASSPLIPDAGFFACQHRAPQYFWKPEYQRHANGARETIEAVMVADDPASLGVFLGKFGGSKAAPSEAGSMRVPLANGGAITVLTANAYATRFPSAPLGPAFRQPALAAFTIAVADLDTARRTMKSGGVQFDDAGGEIVVPAFGTAIAFVQAR